MTSLAERRALLTAVLGCARLPDPLPREVRPLTRWLRSWAGLGAVAHGMTAQGFNLELKEFPEGWRANFYAVGIAHSAVLGSAYEREPWTAVQRAAWQALGAWRSPTPTAGREGGAS